MEVERVGARSEAGETLVESLIAIAIVAIVGLVAYSGLQTALKSSSHHSESAKAETVLRTAAERLQDPDPKPSDHGVRYRALAGCGAPLYDPIPDADYPDDIDPDDYPIVVKVKFWAPPASASNSTPTTAQPHYTTTFVSCPAPDAGLQQVTMSITTPSGLEETLTILKRDD